MSCCAICLDDTLPVVAPLKLACGHEFHATCLQGWLPKHGTCPTCRSTATPLLFVPRRNGGLIQNTFFVMRTANYYVATRFDLEAAREYAQAHKLELIASPPFEFIETYNIDNAVAYTLDKSWGDTIVHDVLARLMRAVTVFELASLQPQLAAVDESDSEEDEYVIFAVHYRQQLGLQVVAEILRGALQQEEEEYDA